MKDGACVGFVGWFRGLAYSCIMTSVRQVLVHPPANHRKGVRSHVNTLVEKFFRNLFLW